MKTKRYSTEQIISILKEADVGMSVQELCRKHGISDATIYNWKSKYGSLSISESHCLKALEEENHRLKTRVADQALDIQMLKESSTKNMVTPEAKRKAVEYLHKRFGRSIRKLCKLIGFNRSSSSYQGKPDNAYIESFNGKLRDECLTMNWFMSLEHALQRIGQWREYYQSIRPHSTLKQLTPKQFLERHSRFPKGSGLISEAGQVT